MEATKVPLLSFSSVFFSTEQFYDGRFSRCKQGRPFFSAVCYRVYYEPSYMYERTSLLYPKRVPFYKAHMLPCSKIRGDFCEHCRIGGRRRRDLAKREVRGKTEMWAESPSSEMERVCRRLKKERGERERRLLVGFALLCLPFVAISENGTRTERTNQRSIPTDDDFSWFAGFDNGTSAKSPLLALHTGQYVQYLQYMYEYVRVCSKHSSFSYFYCEHRSLGVCKLLLLFLLLLLLLLLFWRHFAKTFLVSYGMY